MRLDAERIHAAATDEAMRIVRDAPASDYGLTDLFTYDDWIYLLRKGLGSAALSGTICGAVTALHARGVTAMDVSLARADERIPVGEAELFFARVWLSNGLRTSGFSRADARDVTISVIARGWASNALKLTSVILGVLALAISAASRAAIYAPPPSGRVPDSGDA